MLAGILTIKLGVLFCVAGLTCLALQFSQHDYHERHRYQWHTFAAAGLLLVNIPLAMFYTQSALDVDDGCEVIVVNESGQELDSFVVNTSGKLVEFGPVPAGKEARQRLVFFGRGPLAFNMRQQELEIAGQLQVYADGKFSAGKTIRIRPDGRYVVEPASE